MMWLRGKCPVGSRHAGYKHLRRSALTQVEWHSTYVIGLRCKSAQRDAAPLIGLRAGHLILRPNTPR
jgi:hypothetical protein